MRLGCRLDRNGNIGQRDTVWSGARSNECDESTDPRIERLTGQVRNAAASRLAQRRSRREMHARLVLAVTHVCGALPAGDPGQREGGRGVPRMSATNRDADEGTTRASISPTRR
jgi:hypothetical protein